MPKQKSALILKQRREDIETASYPTENKHAITLFLDAYDDNVLTVDPPVKANRDTREQTHSTSTQVAYASTLHRTAQWLAEVDTTLLSCTARDLNQIAQGRLNGTHHSVSSDGITQNTVHQNQVAWRSFYQFHDHHHRGFETAVDAGKIILAERDNNSVDERDIFDAEDIQAMREACRNKRDRAVLELLVYTGQRHNALRLLTVKDVRPEEGESGMLYLPDIEYGLKGADGKRPLLGAQKACREWKQAHPTGEPDDAFITHVYEWSGRDIDPGDHLSRDGFGRIPKRIAKRAGVDKPANPHAFRHYFTTMAVAEHGMSFDTVRHLIGHAEGTRELERTYQHLVDDDYIEDAEFNMGIRDEKEASLTPSVCFTCNEPLKPSMKYCPNCGQQYGPEADDLEGEIETLTTEAAFDATTADRKQVVKTFIDGLKNDPELKNQLLALMDDVDADSVEDADGSLSR